MSAELIQMTDALYDYLHQVSYREQPIIADNTLFQGMVEPSTEDDEIRSRFVERGAERSESIVRSTHHLREFNRLVSTDTRVSLSMVPVGDGMMLGVKR